MQGKEHMNFQAVDPRLGPALLSVKDISCQGGPKVYGTLQFVKDNFKLKNTNQKSKHL